MLIEGYFAIGALALILVGGLVLWADSFYQEGRRQQRLQERQRWNSV